MAKGFGLDASCDLLISHLLQECGSMTEYCDWPHKGRKRSDGGLAFGIAQWHLCWREKPWMLKHKFAWYDPTGKCHLNVRVDTIRDVFFQEHPDMRDWRGQAKRYLTEISTCRDKKQTVEQCIDSWNANPAYMSHVRSKLPQARKLLTPSPTSA